MYFCKYTGIGNDFVVVEGSAAKRMCGPLAKRICDRHFGIGADGVLVILPAKDPNLTAQMVIYNSDGTIAEMCGNGLRCVAYHLLRSGWSNSPKMAIETGAGIKYVNVEVKSAIEAQVTVDMGKIVYSGPHLPPVDNSGYVEKEISDGTVVRLYPASAGNPHCIIPIPEDADPWQWAEKFGPELEINPAFPAKTNVEFVKKLSPDHYQVVVFERGCGITLACGTGATSVSSVMMDYFQAPTDHITITLPGGDLTFRRLDSGNMEMCGPARLVFSGEVLC